MNFSSKTAAHFYHSSLLVFLVGLPNFYIEHLNVSKQFYKIYRNVSICLNILIMFFLFFELGSFFTQINLTNQQQNTMMINGLAHPIVCTYCLILWRRKKDVKKLFIEVLTLKNIYNDERIEMMMIKKSNRDSGALVLACGFALLTATVGAFLQFIKSEGNFTTVITMWPLVDDPSREAVVVRFICNFMWWTIMSRILASFHITITLTTSMSFQFMNLQSYFYSLDSIFKNDNLNQKEKERMYEESFKLGIQLHIDTIKCVKKFRSIFESIFTGQILFVLITLVCLMIQMVKSERTMVNYGCTVISGISVLISTGFFVWNAGDITVEASKLPNAMYSSGWHNCQGKKSYRIRKLVVISMTFAQEPVIIKGFGIMELSYQFYVSLVKSSYSVFSILH